MKEENSELIEGRGGHPYTLPPRKKKMKNENSELIEGIDFYFEKGSFIFTEKYHKDKGYCCENNCRHCPYGFREKVGKV